MEALLVALPKVELHVYLEGSMPPELLLELTRRHRVLGVPTTAEGLREWYRFRDFEHFIAVYETATRALRDGDDIAELVERVAAGLAAQNVRYAEVIVTPLSHLTRGTPAAALFRGLESSRLAVRHAHGIELRWIADFECRRDAAAGEATLDAVLEADLDSIIGFNVGGLEVDRDPFEPVFTRARAAGLHSTPHAGEASGPDRIRTRDATPSSSKTPAG